MEILHSMKPVIDQKSKILILGSMPGPKSLELQQYYANERNHFWKIMCSLFNVELIDNYDEKLKFILSKQIGLWDVLHTCVRKGALDSDILQPEINDFENLLQNYPNIQYIALNGSKASKMMNKAYRNKLTSIKEFIELPSTSPTPGKNVLSLDDKIIRWRQIKAILEDAES